ncbi:NAD/NADP-dependent octopine/nopaline dehydrogenase family protein [Clostridium sp. 'deep sea']|uniref:NAD/NADP-dependent octopine/nopaline dehydrogenase family protein n=1 Tax=Clostridium sp. 'deep sea' TaxID=2779445 RepID=UPI0024345C1F|nr:NAD/NADP-dependent octopine/nopaline dehydrogenase family protein [Clostridium sp. 'deep sea']
MLGAGNGGQTLAGHLALKGFKVNLYDPDPDKIRTIRKIKGINLIGAIRGFGKLSIITTNLKDALKGSNIIMVVVPADAHKDVAITCAPYLTEDQIVILNPGRTGGALEFSRYINENIVVAEAQTLIYACRSLKPGLCQVYGIKKSVPIAAFPGYKIPQVISHIKSAIPQFVPCKSVIETSLSNIGAVFHPIITILNSSRIENGEKFNFYTDGVTKSVASIIEEVDKERIAIAKSLGVNVISAHKWLLQAYGSKGKDLYSAIHNTHSYKGIIAPSSLQTRYLYEDVPTGLIPLASIGKLLEVKTTTINSLINIASIICNKDFTLTGRTIFDMGLNSLNKNSIENYVINGRNSDDEKESA